jgi:hypothetical protein
MKLCSSSRPLSSIGPEIYAIQIYPTFRIKVLILVNFLSIKPRISISQKLEEVLMLYGQIEYQGPLPQVRE